MNRKELIDAIASIEHEQWMHWARGVFPEVLKERQFRWQKYLVPYEKLDEETKEMDRQWAIKVIALVEEHCHLIQRSGKKDAVSV